MSSLASAATQVRDAVGLGHEGDSTPGEPPRWDTSWPTATLPPSGPVWVLRALPSKVSAWTERSSSSGRLLRDRSLRFQGQKLSLPPERLTYFSPRHMRQPPVLVPLLCWWRKLNEFQAHILQAYHFSLPTSLWLNSVYLLVYFSYSYFVLSSFKILPNGYM